MQIVEWGKALEPRDYPDPAPQGTEVLVKVAACGVCHSDLHIHEGYFDLGGGRKLELAKLGVKLPHTLGHEIVGEVVALGPEATGVKPGDKRLVLGVTQHQITALAELEAEPSASAAPEIDDDLTFAAHLERAEGETRTAPER